MNNIGGYAFKNLNMLTEALTHSSFSSKNYERLEFLGDSILDFLVADILYVNKNYKEAELTRARANIVSEESLSKVFDTLKIEDRVKLGKSCRQITKAIKILGKENFAMLNNTDIPVAIKFADIYGVKSVNEVPMKSKKDFCCFIFSIFYYHFNVFINL